MPNTFSLEDAYGAQQQTAPETPATPASPTTFSLDDAYGAAQTVKAGDLETAKQSLHGISVKEFEENNLFIQMGAAIYKHLTGQQTEGSLTQLTPEAKKYAVKLGMEAPDVPWYRVPTALLERFHESPLTTLVELGKGIIYDPELLGAGVAKSPQLAMQILKGAAIGGGLSGAMSIAKQAVQKDKIDLEQAAKDSVGGATFGAVLAGVAPKGKKGEPPVSDPAVNPDLPPLEVIGESKPGIVNTIRPANEPAPIPTPQTVPDVPMAGAYANVTGMEKPPVTMPPPREPTMPPELANPQSGFVDPKLLARMSAVGIGALTGAYLDKDNRIEGAVLGMLGGALLTRATPTNLKNLYQRFSAKAPETDMGRLGDVHEETVMSSAVMINSLQRQIEDLVPNVERRNAITHWVEGDRTISLSEPELKAAKLAQGFFSDMKDVGLASDVLKSARDNYVTHLWEFGKQTPGFIQSLIEKKHGPGMSPKSQFAKERTINTIAEGKDVYGLTPLTEDISTIMGIYGNSMARSIANKELIDSLKTAKMPDGLPFVLPTGEAPRTYVGLGHPQMTGLRVHPDLEQSMKFYFGSRDPNVAMRALEGINTATKRMNVSFSLFHAKALTDAFVAGTNKFWQAPGKIYDFVTAKDQYLNELNKIGLTQNIQRAIKGGLTFTLEKRDPAVEDVGGSFYRGMHDLQGFLDQTVPGLGKPVKKLEDFNHAVDTFTWARLHTGMKLNIFNEKFSSLMENNAKMHARDPAWPLMSETDAAKIAASFTNDLFGGINWRRVAEGVKNRWGRQLALGLASPNARRGLQFLLFAPDWTLSTTRAMLKAAGKGTGLRGLVEAKTLADLHRQYLVKSAIYYMAVGTALNQAFTGHNIWDNKDPTRIDMGGGRTMQWSKHTMEPVHWFLQPGQQALNKLGYFPKQAAEQAMGVEYLTAHGKMPVMKESRLGHVAHSLAPIGFSANTPEAFLGGMLGVPIYGMTPAERQAAALKARLKKIQEGK